MKEREGVAENVSLGDLPNLDDIPGILDQVLLGEDRSFGLTGRSGGINEDGRVVEVSLVWGYPWGRGWK